MFKKNLMVLSIVFLAGCDGSSDSSSSSCNQTTTSSVIICGTLTLPQNQDGKSYKVSVFSGSSPQFLQASVIAVIPAGSGTSVAYEVVDPALGAGTYFVMAEIDVTGDNFQNGTGVSNGDYKGWYGPGSTTNPSTAPSAANVAIKGSVEGITVTDITVEEMPPL